MDALIAPFIESAKAGDTGSLLSLLVHARDEESGASMGEGQVRDEVLTFFIAGHETTSLALTWTLHLLAAHPEILQAAREEVSRVSGGRRPVAGDYESLVLVKNIFRESLRLYPPAWTFAREAKEDIVICDYFFPKGSVLWTITWLLHHTEEHFPEAEKFRPERWSAIPEGSKLAYFPFGAGPRMCIGEGFAWMEGVLVLASILSRYSLSPVPGPQIGVSPLFTLKPSSPIILEVTASFS